eukprot:TRINITY_DN1235_c0_g1_i1.p1 TRINITY_DN1235_c0_g1~~TRINITY_DN1235_c0_g1_i1.p1  ORF type:complete len:216 (+),score=38.38 TRINITY_DN1235_c0_g1_i1:39-650(+)
MTMMRKTRCLLIALLLLLSLLGFFDGVSVMCSQPPRGSSDELYDLETIVELVNSDPSSTWKAGINSVSSKDKVMRLESFPKDVQEWLIRAEEARRERRSSLITQQRAYGSSSSPLPVNFDAREQWPDCIHPVLDQGDCGSCWAFASSEVLSDRFCIHSSGAINVVLSPQNLLSCEKMNLKCELGSLPEWAWSFLENTGIVTMV